jgi:hypothetical protein
MKSVRDLLILDNNLEVGKEQGEKEGSKLGTAHVHLGSLPASVCRELVLELVANYLPDELVDHETLPKVGLAYPVFVIKIHSLHRCAIYFLRISLLLSLLRRYLPLYR